MKTLFGCISLLLVFGGCTSTINSATGAQAKIKSHQTIAILPFEVRFDLRNKNRKKFSDKELAEVRHFMATGLQEYLYGWLNHYSNTKPFTVTIQHVDVTDSILSDKKISYMVLYNMGRTELANILGVDAVLTPNVIFAQPNSPAVAALLNPIDLFDPLNPSNSVFLNEVATQEMKMQVLVTDKSSETPIWAFETKTQNSRSYGFSTKRQKENILYPLFDNIDKTLTRFIKKFPYVHN
ncbi:MAG: hypothetical protein JNM14_15940 [Ferruginibacter sp.]|nr:hypothetical protein [Ferruginibacter sp.]